MKYISTRTPHFGCCFGSSDDCFLVHESNKATPEMGGAGHMVPLFHFKVAFFLGLILLELVVLIVERSDRRCVTWVSHPEKGLLRSSLLVKQRFQKAADWRYQCGSCKSSTPYSLTVGLLSSN